MLNDYRSSVRGSFAVRRPINQLSRKPGHGLTPNVTELLLPAVYLSFHQNFKDTPGDGIF